MSDAIITDMPGTGPFQHSDRVPKPNTLPKNASIENMGSHSNDTEKRSKFQLPEFNMDFLTKVYHAAHLYLLYLFIVVYLVIYVGLAVFLKKNSTDNIELLLKRIFDYTIALILIAGTIYLYVDATPDQKKNVIVEVWNWSIEWMKDPINLYGIALFTVAFYIWVFFMHINMKDEYTPYLIHLLEHKLWAILVFFVIFFFIQYFLQIDIYGFFFGNELVNGIIQKVTDEKINSQGLIEKKKAAAASGNAVVKGNTAVKGNAIVKENPPVTYDQVFNIGNNLYTYEDAQHVCSAYGSRMATYDEIEDAYNHGAEWCNYGWSEDQMAFFPTQKATWDTLQKDPANKNKCGRPGVNGGYMANKFLRFGVNCFGKKPEPSAAELAAMNNQTLPRTAEQAVIDQKVEFWKKNKDALLKVNSFNKKQWSEY